MQAFEQLNKREKFTHFCFYVFIALLPIIGLISISTYAFIYLKEDLDFVSKELDGLHVITQAQESAFKYQRLRGLSSIVSCECQETNKKIANDIVQLKEELSQDLLTLTKRIRSKQSSALQAELLTYLQTLDPHNGATDFESFSKTIYQLLYFASKISYECNLKFEPHLESHIMADNVALLLPNIIEYNGQIRAVSSAIQNKRLTQEQQEHIRMQLSKLQDHLDLLHFHFSLLSSFHLYAQLETKYHKMLDAQDEIIHIVRNELLQKESVEINGLSIYLLITNNIDLIIELYRSNAEYLQKELQEKYDGTKTLLNALFIVSFFSLLFILYVHYYFYQTNKRFIDTIENLSITDGMTHLYNRRYFDLIIEQQLKLLHRHKESFAFMLLDIDFFKQYNDTYGHQAGDEALKKVAVCLQEALHRESDMAFRLGGEEFGVVAVDMDEHQALELAQKIRGLIASAQIAHKSSSINPYLSVSIGVIVVSPTMDWDVNKVYRSADKALYDAKNKGRNRVSLYQANM